MLELKDVRWAIVIAIGIGVLIAALFLLVLGGVSFPLAFGVGVYVYLRQVQPGAIVLWFRRFKERPERGGFRFPHVLSSARSRLFVPLTLQDSSFERSFLAQQLTGTRVIFGIIVANIAGVGGMMVFMLSALELGASADLAAFMMVLGGILGFGGVLLISFKKGGYVSVTSLEEAARRLTKIERGRGSYAGIQVLKCADEIWKPVVEYALAHAGAAVFDVSEISESLSWELAAAQRIIGPRRIVLTCSYIDKRELPEGVDSLLRGIGGCELEDMPIIWYPARHTRGPGYQNVTTELRRILLNRR